MGRNGVIKSASILGNVKKARNEKVCVLSKEDGEIPVFLTTH